MAPTDFCLLHDGTLGTGGDELRVKKVTRMKEDLAAWRAEEMNGKE